jgi:circadian clock protein KaiC
MDRRQVSIQRLPTGVPGLDEVLAGGIPEFSFNLIGGAPGSGKTTLAHQIMFALATPERPALYFTALGEAPLKMLRYQQQFEFFDEALLNNAVRFVNLTDDARAGRLDTVRETIMGEVARFAPGLVFVDSFRSLIHADASHAEPGPHARDFVHQLGVEMTSWQATTFLLGEYSTDSEATPVFTVADGLIWLRQSVQGNSVVRKLQIVKMRGAATVPGLHTFRIDSRGVEVFPPAGTMELATEGVRADLPDSLAATGVQGLDAMLEGGLPRGYSVLVAGPSGSGKSMLAASFLAEGARRGETGVIAAFEQDPNRSRHRVVSDLVAAGVVGLVDSRARDLSIDEIVRLVLVEIRRLKATRVVVDSLSGFELALAPTFKEEFRESMARMVKALVCEGVTVMLTSELEDRYTDLRFSPYGTAFLTDAIIVQRYIEVESRLLRVMAVVKVRASNHSNELREYCIDGDGIHVGAMLPQREGLLGGRPTATDGPLQAARTDDAAVPAVARADHRAGR